jgi:transcriptional regulator with XRE-family HTH domain
VSGRDWRRLGDYVVRRRNELEIHSQAAFEEATGISYRTLSRLETGHSVSRNTLRTVERVLQWEIYSADDILDGGAPTPAGTRQPLKPLTPLQREALAELDVLMAKGVPDDEAIDTVVENARRALERSRRTDQSGRDTG